jgi:hypothetical protein
VELELELEADEKCKLGSAILAFQIVPLLCCRFFSVRGGAVQGTFKANHRS